MDGVMCILALFLEGVADTSYLSGKGMGYFMLLAMAIRGSYTIRKKTIKINAVDNKQIEDTQIA